MKKILLLSALAIGTLSFAQVNSASGINVVPSKNVFLDASFYNGVADKTLGKGLNFPRTDLTTFSFKTSDLGQYQYFLSAFDGMVVYNTGTGNTGNTAATQGQVVAVTPGFYYFSNPTATEDTTDVSTGKWVRIGGADLATGVANGNFWSLIGNSGTTAATVTETQGTAGQPGTYTYAKSATGNFMGTTDNQAVVMTSNNIPRLSIGAQSGVSVGANTFNFVLDVFGKARFRDGIVTSNSTYPDYVFDKYFTGKSAENAKYNFLTLADTEKYIKENNHLPGVTSINELAKENGKYMIDATQLSVQSLEKIEELYLHTIEQQKEIDALKAEIKEIKASLKK